MRPYYFLCRSGLVALSLLCLTSVEPSIASTMPDSGTAAQTWERYMSRAGVAVGGEFRSAMIRSVIEGPASVDTLGKTEVAAFTGADIDLAISPTPGFGGRAVFRLQQDWSDFFVSAQNSFFTRWLSIDGQSGAFTYHAGDFREKYTPLTLYTPQVSVLYEPELFSRDREAAMREEFVWNNERTLQGANLGLNAQLKNKTVTVLDVLDLRTMAVRLRQTGIPNNGLFAPSETDLAEKYLLGGHLSLSFLKGMNAGGSLLWLVDRKDSYKGDKVFMDIDSYKEMQLQNTTIEGLHGGLSIDELLGWDAFSVALYGEYAHSSDRPVAPLDSIRLSSSVDYLHTDTIDLRSSRGDALLVSAGAGMTAGPFTPDLSFSYHFNEPDFVNELSQSPSFLPSRIMNYSNDTAWQHGNRSQGQYSTFDALYSHVFRYRPSETVGVLSRNVPGTKNSFSNVVFTRRELQTIQSNGFDPSLQLAMPLGPSTPNRTGFECVLKSDLSRHAALSAVLSRLAQVRVDDSLSSKRSYSTVGGGIRAGLGTHQAWPVALDGTVSYTLSSVQGERADSASTWTQSKLTVDFLNLGARIGFLKRAALLGGYQRITANATLGDSSGVDTQHHLGIGFEYGIRPNVFIGAMLGKISVDHSAAEWQDFSQAGSDLSLNVAF